jgi:hypothetical protein
LFTFCGWQIAAANSPIFLVTSPSQARFCLSVLSFSAPPERVPAREKEGQNGVSSPSHDPCSGKERGRRARRQNQSRLEDTTQIKDGQTAFAPARHSRSRAEQLQSLLSSARRPAATVPSQDPHRGKTPSHPSPTSNAVLLLRHPRVHLHRNPRITTQASQPGFSRARPSSSRSQIPQRRR